jgi:hypothetical protein
MSHDRTLGDVEADLAALRAAADRASQALAGLFAAGDRDGPIPGPRHGSVVLTILLTFTFLMM